MASSVMTRRLTRTRSAAFALPAARSRRERPRRRTAECSQQFPPSDGDCHTLLPCEVRKGNDTTPRACCPLVALLLARGLLFRDRRRNSLLFIASCRHFL